MSKYAIVDLEMCNVPRSARKEEYHSRSEIIQIGAVLLDEKYEICDRFVTFVHPQYGVIDNFIRNLTGITQKDTADAPLLEEALKAFAAWLPEDAVLVSWSESDEYQVRRELELKGLEIDGLAPYLDNWIDCQQTFADKMDTDRCYNLTEALSVAGIIYDDGAHDALVDAKNTALLFAKMSLEPDFKLVKCIITPDEVKNSSYKPFADLLKGLKL